MEVFLYSMDNNDPRSQRNPERPKLEEDKLSNKNLLKNTLLQVPESIVIEIMQEIHEVFEDINESIKIGEYPVIAIAQRGGGPFIPILRTMAEFYDIDLTIMQALIGTQTSQDGKNCGPNKDEKEEIVRGVWKNLMEDIIASEKEISIVVIDEAETGSTSATLLDILWDLIEDTSSEGEMTLSAHLFYRRPKGVKGEMFISPECIEKCKRFIVYHVNLFWIDKKKYLGEICNQNKGIRLVDTDNLGYTPNPTAKDVFRFYTLIFMNPEVAQATFDKVFDTPLPAEQSGQYDTLTTNPFLEKMMISLKEMRIDPNERWSNTNKKKSGRYNQMKKNLLKYINLARRH